MEEILTDKLQLLNIQFWILSTIPNWFKFFTSEECTALIILKISNKNIVYLQINAAL